jgi:hypothetical protein
VVRSFSVALFSLKEQLMWDVASDRVRVAERIAYTEDSIDKLRQRVTRLRAEGSDATQAEELLVVAKGALAHLHTHQSELRPRRWILSR